MILSLRTVINGNVNVNWYSSNNVVMSSLIKSSQNNFSSLTALYSLKEEHDNIIYENNLRKIVEYERLVSIGKKDPALFFSS